MTDEKVWHIVYTPTHGPRGILAVRSTFDRLGMSIAIFYSHPSSEQITTDVALWAPKCKKQRIRYGRLQDADGDLFPGYIFVKSLSEYTNDTRLEQALLDNASGYFLKGPGSTHPATISEEEIQAVKNEEISETPTDHPMIIEKGAYVEITVGMVGVKGHVLEVKSNNEVVIETSLLGRCTPVTINAAYITKLQGEGNEAQN